MTGYEEGLRAVEEYRRAIADRHYEAYRYLAPLPDAAHQAWCLPAGATEWELIGYASEPIVGVDYGPPDPELVVAWPRQYGERSLSLQCTFQVPGHDALVEMFEPLFAAARASTERRVARLAIDLALYPDAARRLFDQVQRVLEEAGVGDGYGQLTIRQPVRPPAEPPSVPQLLTVYPDPYDRAFRGGPGTPFPLTLRSLPRPGP